MLQIQDIRKKYVTGDLVQTALDGVSLTLRDNEFVAILGPSGSGKTTLLNVIGGLDRYDSGDLVINGISTQHYTDRDWDSYRNHTIGFVFQSYNLIPHQTVLANVELALTISGISRAERKRRAIDALSKVGLGDQIHKRPSQMSGGQMQRVAIARALVNNPDILLADEPTGALDSETSLQVMELLKEVSKDRLVVMVTHNPELAEEYANRIVRVKDGQIVGDTNPCMPVTDEEPPQHKNMGRSSMSYFTALALSFNNLLTKKGRTILTAFAGSIGIIGIALILSLSTGFQRYIDQIQEDTLSNYPLSIQSESADMDAALSAFSSLMASGEDNGEGTVAEQQMITQMFAQVGSNDLGAFKKHLDENMESIESNINSIQYGYGIKPRIYAADTSKKIVQVNPGVLFGELTGSSMMSSYMDSDVFQQMVDAPELIRSQYEVIEGRWPEKYDEMILVLSDPYSMTDYMSYTLGIRDADELKGMVEQVMKGEELEVDTEPMSWTYEQLMALDFRLVASSDIYKHNTQYDVWEDMSGNKPYMRKLIEEGEKLKIVGIVCPKDGAAATMLMPGVAYTSALTDHVIETAKDKEIVKAQLKDLDTDVFTGSEFGAEEDEKELDFEDMITVDEEQLKNAFGGMDESIVGSVVERYMAEIAESFMLDPTGPQNDFLDVFKKLANDMLSGYITTHADPETGEAEISTENAETIAAEYLATEGAVAIISELTQEYMIPEEVYVEVYKPLLSTMIISYVAIDIVPDELLSALESITPTPAPSAAPEGTGVGGLAGLLGSMAVGNGNVNGVQVMSTVTIPELNPIEEGPESSAPGGLPEISLPDDLPDIELPEDIPTVELPGDLPEIELPDIELPEDLPDIELPEELPEIDLPEDLPDIELPEDLPDIELPGDIPDVDLPEELPEIELPEELPEPEMPNIQTTIGTADIEPLISEFAANQVVVGIAGTMAEQMNKVLIQKMVMGEVMEYTSALMGTIANGFNVDQDAIANAFQFNMDEEELTRLMEAMTMGNQERDANTNLKLLGYADRDVPTSISVYLIDFEAKEEFMDFIDLYNKDMEAAGEEDLIISYTDVTGIMMSSVRTIVDSVSYVLIAFVAVSLVVSSIMIGIITYISVMERTKEIGILRAIGASKRNISQVFNAETFIIGLCSGLLGVGISLLLLIPINYVIHTLTGIMSITAQLPSASAVILVVLSVVLTLIGGLIPSKKAATKDPVIALRSE